jgi:hypothetical protein
MHSSTDSPAPKAVPREHAFSAPRCPSTLSYSCLVHAGTARPYSASFRPILAVLRRILESQHRAKAHPAPSVWPSREAMDARRVPYRVLHISWYALQYSCICSLSGFTCRGVTDREESQRGAIYNIYNTTIYTIQPSIFIYATKYTAI